MLKNERLAEHSHLPKILLFIFAGVALIVWARALILPALQLVAGGAVIAFLLEPLARQYEKRIARGPAALLSLISGAIMLAAFIAVLVPPIVRQLGDLLNAVPGALAAVQNLLARIGSFFRARGLDLALAQPDLSALSDRIVYVVQRMLGAAGSFAGFISKFSLMIVLSFFFLRDRDKLFLRLELLVPFRARRTAVQLGSAIRREMRLYLRGQAMIALAVGTLSSFGLMLVGVPSALVLGLLVGVFNMIPYFGPILGSIPAVVMALGSSPMTALWAVAVLIIVQQMDGSLISPRIMGNLTGFSPAVVLIAVFIGGQAAGVAGMLAALPLLMAARTCLHICIQHSQND